MILNELTPAEISNLWNSYVANTRETLKYGEDQANLMSKHKFLDQLPMAKKENESLFLFLKQVCETLY